MLVALVRVSDLFNELPAFGVWDFGDVRARTLQNHLFWTLAAHDPDPACFQHHAVEVRAEFLDVGNQIRAGVRPVAAPVGDLGDDPNVLAREPGERLLDRLNVGVGVLRRVLLDALHRAGNVLALRPQEPRVGCGLAEDERRSASRNAGGFADASGELLGLVDRGPEFAGAGGDDAESVGRRFRRSRLFGRRDGLANLGHINHLVCGVPGTWARWRDHADRFFPSPHHDGLFLAGERESVRAGDAGCIVERRRICERDFSVLSGQNCKLDALNVNHSDRLNISASGFYQRLEHLPGVVLLKPLLRR